MICRFSRHRLRSCGVSLAPFAFWLLTLLLPSTACGQGNFLPGLNYPVSDVAAGFAVGDINGDKNFTLSTSSPFVQGVNQASTTTAISSSQNPSTSGQSVTFT